MVWVRIYDHTPEHSTQPNNTYAHPNAEFVIERMIEKGIALFFAGSLMAMVIYHVILFLLYRQGKEYIYLALLCAGILLRTLTLNANGIPLQYLFPQLSFEVFKKIEYFSVYGLMAILPLYFRSLFPEEFPQRFLKIFTAFGITFSLITLVTRFQFYYSILNICHLVYVVELCVIAVVLYRAMKVKRPEASITLFGLGASAPLVFIEIFANSGFFDQQLSFLLELAVLTFLVFQAFILAKRNAKAYFLAEMNKVDLEKAIASKTIELSESNVLKNMLLSVMSHDVKSPLNSIKGVLTLMNSDYLKPEEMKPVTLQLEQQVQNTSMLVDNILHWCASQSRTIAINKTKLRLRPLVDECFSLFTFQARNKNISLVNEVAGGIFIIADENIMKLVLRNLISNALKFSNEGGFIKASHQQQNSQNCIVIEDNGIGIEKEKLSTLFDIDKNVSSIGTKQELGTGLGLSLCKKFLQAMGSEIVVESSPRYGSKFFIQVANFIPDANFTSIMYIESKVA
jgi:signal transduction histidine kinase